MYLQIAEIQGDPFSIHPDSSIHSIRAAMEDFGCLVGAFEYDATFDLYLGPPNVYFIAPAEGGVNRPLHYVLICGVGSLDDADDGRPFLQIQNSFGTNWGNGGYGYIAKDLFHHIHGLRGVTLFREEGSCPPLYLVHPQSLCFIRCREARKHCSKIFIQQGCLEDLCNWFMLCCLPFLLLLLIFL
ncbi:putative peptidase C1A, papain [Medicago truncatula]|uniref:Putative peptidase C1A, papain n=1 Tax=Medicago truncatula TaxID=3880 RepID=A0A396JGQ7_MEDTR|nr:putative peptidase C1A, papain [Medicago truncatula]